MSSPEIIALPNKIDSILVEILQQYSQSANDLSIEDFMRNVLVASAGYETKEKAASVAQNISLAVDAIRMGYQAIQGYKSRGLSNGVWLRDTLDTATSAMQQVDKNTIISSVKQALAQANTDCVSILTGGELKGPLVQDLIYKDFMGIDKTGIAQNIKEEIEVSTLFGAIGTNIFCPPPNIFYPQLDIVKDFFEANLDESSDDNFKKVIATAIELAKERDLLPESLASWDICDLTVVVDRGVSGAKLAYKVAQGEVSATDATDYLVDRAVSTAGTVVMTACGTYGTTAGASIGGALGAIFGPAAAVFGAKIGSALGSFAGKLVGEGVLNGVKKIARSASVVVEKIWDVATNAASRVGEIISDGASWVGSKISDAWDRLTDWW